MTSFYIELILSLCHSGLTRMSTKSGDEQLAYLGIIEPVRLLHPIGQIGRLILVIHHTVTYLRLKFVDKPYLKTDFLLITRLRNCLTNDKGGSYFTSIGGAHGVGTKAIQLLMGANIDRQHRQLLHDIDRELQGASEFQILIKVSEIDQLVTGFEPKRLRLEAVVPLHITDKQYAALHQWIQRQLQRIKQSITNGHEFDQGSNLPNCYR